MCVVVLPPSVVEGSDLDRARHYIAKLRYDQATGELVDIAKDARGDEKQEALYLLAGLKTSVSEAQIIYQEVIQLDPSSEWGEKSQIELAKIQYALGNYDRALRILEGSSACGHSTEACFFQGLAAVMLKRFEEAKRPLTHIRRGRYRPWAYLTLAEIEMNLHNVDEACRQYRSMARTSISPTAMYRYAECLETQGDTRRAKSTFEDIVDRFGETPEAMLAAQKLQAMEGVWRQEETKDPEEQHSAPLTSGFTLQFGSFQDRTNAIKLAAGLKRHLPGVRIDSDLIRYREVYRVRFGYFATREEAEREADALSRRIREPVTIMTLP